MAHFASPIKNSWSICFSVKLKWINSDKIKNIQLRTSRLTCGVWNDFIFSLHYESEKIINFIEKEKEIVDIASDYSDVEHIDSFDGVLTQAESNYVVYYYSANCGYCNLIKETINNAKSTIPVPDPKKETVQDTKEKVQGKTVQEIDREKLEQKFSKDKKETLN